MTRTTNYNLKKPESTDFYNIADHNDNMDTIDDALLRLANLVNGHTSTISDHATTLAGKQAKAISTTVYVYSSDWSSAKTCTKSVSGVTADNIVFCQSSNPLVSCTAQGSGTLTFTATTTPSSTTTVKVVILP